MVKTCTAENTLLETARKDRWLPDLKRKYSISYNIESTYGGVAQLGEHLPCKQGVKSSNLSISIEVAKQLLKFGVPLHDKRLFLENFIQRLKNTNLFFKTSEK